jgi:hypothetical protein
MTKSIRNTLKLFVFLQITICYSQKEFGQWFFSNQAGLNFTTEPPTIFLAPNNFTIGNPGSIADTAGNLLFYSSQNTIWNSQHTTMANGTGIPGNVGISIVKKPGSNNLFYIFEYVGNPNIPGVTYSIVDMNLAAGLGSVTVKGSTITSGCRIGVLDHANGMDYWILTHEFNSNNFRSYLLTSAGMSSTPVISSSGYSYTSTHSGWYINSAPNGRRLACSVYDGSTSFLEIYDFDKSTGIVSGALKLDTLSVYSEFSPDGTKIYSSIGGNYGKLLQWDLCAGSPQAIIASRDSVGNFAIGGSMMQIAKNGKVYVSRGSGDSHLGVINLPNKKGLACQYVDTGQSLGGKLGGKIPRFFGRKLLQTPNNIQFTKDTTKCSFATFTAPCLSAGNYSGVVWIFGDPLSGTSNTNTSLNAGHAFSGPGTYKVRCAMLSAQGIDTLFQVITFSAMPIVTVNGNLTICKNQSTTLTASGAASYSWSSGIQSSVAVVNPSFTTSYSVIGSFSNSACKVSKVFTVTVLPCTGFRYNPDELMISAFPVPANEKIIYTLDRYEKHTCCLRDMLGRVVHFKEWMSDNGVIYLEGLRSGIYELDITSVRGKRSLKIVVR